MKPRTAVALGLAGLATGGLGTSVLPASAQVRTYVVGLTNGKSVTVSVDVPPGTGVWDIDFPGVQKGEIVSITEAPTPAPVTTQQAPAETAPAQPAPAQTTPAQTAPAATTPTQTTPAPAQGEPQVAASAPQAGASEPQVKQGGGRQRTTGRTRRPAVDAPAPAGAQAGNRGQQPGADRSQLPGQGGLPTAADPTTSLATPGPAPLGVPNFFIDKFRIPPFLLSIYQAAGIQYGVRWEVLAAINEIETDYGRNLNVSTAGAVGWMQFMPSTWKQYGVDANRDQRKDPYNPVDAIFGAARYLKAAGADQDLRRAIFAYNHADWYVDSVLMRARLIGGLPSDLVGSLTGLTQGIFPVDARARYADDVDARAATARVAKGHNAAIPVASDAKRRGINVYAKPGSPVVAVQDGRIIKIGHTPRLGKFMQLRDAFGNTYTYAHLKTLAKRHPVPKAVRASVPAATEPPKDPAPTQAASAGRQRPLKKERRSARTTATAASASRAGKQRLYAKPARPAAFKAGGRDQLQAVASKTDVKLLGLPAGQVTTKRLKVGSQVIGGTVLGRIGRTSSTMAPHLLFEIRPAGRGAPRIDPKPILDGWKLLESTAVYRAKGRNPFFGPDARTPTIGQILLMGKTELEQRVLQNPRIEIYGCGRRDVRSSRVDRRILATLEFLASSGLRPTVSSLECGHSLYTASGNVSEHSTGNAVDIAKINGIPVLGHQGDGSITDLAVRRLLTLQGTMRPHQIITLMKYPGTDNTLAMSDHADHIHIGFPPLYNANSKLARQLGATLKPGQWIKLVSRLSEIDNPTVRKTPSKASLAVVPQRGARRGGD